MRDETKRIHFIVTDRTNVIELWVGMTEKLSKLPPLPDIFATIGAGFELTTRHFWLVLLPALLDIFYWLGPRLSIRPLIEEAMRFWSVYPSLKEATDQILAMAPRTNLFSSLSVPLIGVPALMAQLAPEKTPLTPQVVELTSSLAALGILVGLTVVGLLLTAVYLNLIAYVVLRQDPTITVSYRQWGQRVLVVWARLLLIATAFVTLVVLVFFPLSIISLIVAFLSPMASIILLFLGQMLFVWLVIMLVFLPQGLTLNGRNLLRSAVESFQLVRLNLLSTMIFLGSMFLIHNMLKNILLFADDGSWLTLSGILAHAFVSTSFIVATFLFYRDRFAFLEKINSIFLPQG